MLNKHGATRTLDFEGGPYEDTPENLTAATLESIWDDEMRISSPRDIFDRGRVELAWEDIRDCFAAIVEASSGADYRPTRGHFSDIDLALQQEVCRAYASRNAMRGGPSEKTVASQATATMLPSRKQLKGSPLLVLEVIANAPTRLTCQQIIDTLKQQTTPLSESAVKKALQNLTMLGYVDNRQDISPPGYAAVGVHPGVHSKA